LESGDSQSGGGELAEAPFSSWRPSQLVVSTGFIELDALLPEGGVLRGQLVEWIASPGAGAMELALHLARQACADGRSLVVVDRSGELHPPALEQRGWDLKRVLWVRPSDSIDESWAVDQALRCAGAGAVLCPTAATAVRSWRRWQLAAESGDGLGLFFRPPAARRQSCWSGLRFGVSPRSEAEGWRVELLYRRGGCAGAALELDPRDATLPVPVVAELAPAAAGRGPTGAS
jgi:hypothetical protein